MEFEKPKRTTRAPKGRRGPSVWLTPRDLLFLQYIWRWKIASTASVHEAVNQTATPYTTYKTLARLEQNGFIESRFEFAERFYVWQLTERGFHAIKSYLGELKEDGYLSEKYRHDRLVQAFQLGEWATHQFPNVTFCTEQEMRRREVTDYPDWVPQTTDHRSDGYTRIMGEKNPARLPTRSSSPPKMCKNTKASCGSTARPAWWIGCAGWWNRMRFGIPSSGQKPASRMIPATTMFL